MSNSHDNDDWSTDSASLFREARRAHDPTLAESARLAAVLARIQAAKVDESLAGNRGADIVARGAMSKLLRLVSRVSLGVVVIAGASYAFIRVNRHASEPVHTTTPAPPTVAASIPPPIAAQPAPVPSGEISAPAQAPAAPVDETQLRPSGQRRRSRATAERPRTSRIEESSVPEAPSSPHDDSTSAVVPEIGAMQPERPEPRSTAKPVGVTPEATRRETSPESNPHEEAAVAARKADPVLPEGAGTELEMMKRIQGALRDADFSAVLALCAEHARRWPRGVFELEREGVRAIASCGENSDDAALRAKRFLTAHPHAPVAMRVSAACEAQLIKR